VAQAEQGQEGRQWVKISYMAVKLQDPAEVREGIEMPWEKRSKLRDLKISLGRRQKSYHPSSPATHWAAAGE